VLAGDPAGWNTRTELEVVGASPTLARDVVHRLANDNVNLTVNERAAMAGDKLVGFLSAAMLALKMLQLPTAGPVKYRLPLMSRTSFAALFDALPAAPRTVLKAHPAVLAQHMVDASNANVLLPRTQGVDPDTALTVASPLIRAPRRGSQTPNVAQPHELFAGITIGVWVDGLTKGTDYLMPATMRAYLESRPWRQRAWKSEREAALEQLESFGTVGGTDRSRGGGTQLGVFENRAIAPKGGAGLLTIDEVYRMAWNQLIFFKAVRESGQPGRYPERRQGRMPT
jgi:hypothetical protein